MRNILISSLAFAPYSGVGAARMTSLADSLTKEGFDVTVISYDSREFDDSEQKRKVPIGIRHICVKKEKERKKNLYGLKEAIVRCIEDGKFDLWIISVGPFEIMEIVSSVYKRTCIPYIIDNRDIWLFEKNQKKTLFYPMLKHRIYDFLHLPIEYYVMRRAAKVIFVTEYCRRDIKARYHLDESKCGLIRNGYEDGIFIENHVKQTWEHISLGVAGKFGTYSEAAARQCLEACKDCLKFEAAINHIGIPDAELQKQYGDRVYHSLGTMSYINTMKELSKMDAMLITYRFSVGLGTKVYDYIALNKPIIYVGLVPSELSDFITRFENAFICSNKEDVFNAINRIYEEKIEKLTSKIDISEFSRKSRNREYINVINEVIESVRG